MNRFGVLPLICAAALSAAASPVISPKLAVPADIDRGDLLWNELNCSACHAETPANGRLKARPGPVLGKNGLRLTPQFVRAYLADPEGHKHGTTMPDLLHDMPAAERAEAVEALTHFLIESPDANERSFSAQAGKITQGRTLYHTVGCIACHAPEESWQAVLGTDPKAAINPELLGENSIPLGPLAEKITVAELAKFLREPAKYRKSERMPSLKLAEGEAEAIAMYLLRAQASDSNAVNAAPKTIAGLDYEYFETDFGSEPNWDALKPVTTGTVEGFDIRSKRREQSFGFRFTGLINVPVAGEYKFYTISDDSSRLWIGDKMVVDNAGDHPPQERSGTIQLSAGAHPITVTFYNNGAGYELRVLWQAPGKPRQEVPANVLSHMGQPMNPIGTIAFARDAGKAEKGKALFGSLACAACHEHPDVPSTKPSAKSFAEMSASGGCLEEIVKAGLPIYHLNSEQRSTLQKLLADKSARTHALSPDAQVRYTMAALNCVACHTRDAKGGPTDARLQYFLGIGQADLGDEGRVPPHLTKVGQKLRRETMADILERGLSVRPYMATRMPQFGREAVGALPALFEEADGAQTKSEPSTSALDEKWGRKLVGVGGLSCISCHTFANHKSLGIPAVDMTMMTQRLKKDWFHRYLLDPPSLRPGTRMPSFWPHGEAVNKDVLGGNTDAQINAIWAYLTKGRDADLPQGLVTGRKEIVADKEAVIYRNFIRGASPRGIGVGYPEKANLVFDANTMNVVEIWQGAFIDAARHSSGRGEGFEPPLGDRIYELPGGPPFAMLASMSAPWPAGTSDNGAAKNYRMRGYQLNNPERRPTFRYSFGDIQVEDFPIAREGQIDPYFARTLKLRAADAAPNNVYFRAAVGGRIEPQSDGTFLVDGKVGFKLSGEPFVRQAGGSKELLVPVKFNNGAAEIVEEIRW
jgi:cytochrome c